MIGDGTANGAEAARSVDGRGLPPSAAPLPVSLESPSGLVMPPIGPAPIGSNAVEPAMGSLPVFLETALIVLTVSEMDEYSPASSLDFWVV